MIKHLSEIEPVRVYTMVAAVLGLLVAFGVNLSTEQSSAILNVVETIIVVLFPVAGAEFARSKVTPVAKLNHNEHANL